MNGFFTWYYNFGSRLYRFVTMLLRCQTMVPQTDRSTEGWTDKQTKKATAKPCVASAVARYKRDN